MFREDTALTTMFKVWSKVEAMPYLWHSFAQLVQEVKHIAAAKVHPRNPVHILVCAPHTHTHTHTHTTHTAHGRTTHTTLALDVHLLEQEPGALGVVE
jgi:uncharacterized membrane protein